MIGGGLCDTCQLKKKTQTKTRDADDPPTPLLWRSSIMRFVSSPVQGPGARYSLVRLHLEQPSGEQQNFSIESKKPPLFVRFFFAPFDGFLATDCVWLLHQAPQGEAAKRLLIHSFSTIVGTKVGPSGLGRLFTWVRSLAFGGSVRLPINMSVIFISLWRYQLILSTLCIFIVQI